MQTRIGSVLSFAAVLVAAALCCTGRWTGWFSPENPLRYLWVVGGLVAALVLIRLIDRRIWIIRQRAQRAETEAARDAARVAAERRRQDILEVLSDPPG
ncbi:hypothetical protein COZ63_00645 [Candidatus Berkelbacteria bacterium CG_4_8_14_3_um_filter_42_13]|uniref:Uncharacterized protein n=1 Tax=Candidatus Berkelbacteria bacterium CG_4_8_14_3_um_filter_42_13 TaxID=1974505 RepID=A0A2M7K1Z9_9BACT|nr:MAG: hypothetical protein COZ63_00645 [Candidatus Berkelbacteria bacterium CG_4_8_14_3_um_filter_42_13]